MKRIWILDYDGYCEDEGIMDIDEDEEVPRKKEAKAITIPKSERNRQFLSKTWTFVHLFHPLLL